MVQPQKSWMECGVCFTVAVTALTFVAVAIQWALQHATLLWN